MSQSRLNSLSVNSIGRDLIKNCNSSSQEVMEKCINQKERIKHLSYKGDK